MAETAEAVPKYRANRKKFFLTYPRCDLAMETVLEFFKNIGELTRYIIATEKHQDGANHIHCYIEFKDKQDFKNSRWADIDGYHPNDGGAVRNHTAVSRYCTKDGNFITNFFEMDPFALAMSSTSYKEGIEIIKSKRPRDYLLHGKNIESNLKRQFVGKRTRKYTLDDFKLDRIENLNKAVLIVGPSGCGKTQYALAHFENPLLVRHMDKLKELTLEHDGIVFDDMSFKHMPAEAIIHLLDMDEDSDIHCRHSTAVIPAGTKRIFTHNISDIFFPKDLQDAQWRAIRRRYDLIEIDEDIRNTVENF